MSRKSSLFSKFARQDSQKGAHAQGYPTIAGQHYHPTIAEIVEASGAEWYFEIGSRTGDSLARIPCNFIAIDPEFYS